MGNIHMLNNYNFKYFVVTLLYCFSYHVTYNNDVSNTAICKCMYWRYYSITACTNHSTAWLHFYKTVHVKSRTNLGGTPTLCWSKHCRNSSNNIPYKQLALVLRTKRGKWTQQTQSWICFDWERHLQILVRNLIHIRWSFPVLP